MSSAYYSGPTREEIRQEVAGWYRRGDFKEPMNRIFRSYLGDSNLLYLREEFGSLERFLEKDLLSEATPYLKYKEILAQAASRFDTEVMSVSDNYYTPISLDEPFGKTQEERDYFSSLDGKPIDELKKEHLKLIMRNKAGEEVYYFEELPYYRFSAVSDNYANFTLRVTREPAILESVKNGVPADSVNEIEHVLRNYIFQKAIVNEMTARVGKSLLMLYFGEPQELIYPLDEQIIGVFNRFEYNGKKVFGKAISKARVGLDLKEEGWSPERISKTLEYETSYEHHGKRHNWPSLNYKFKRPIKRHPATLEK